MSIGSVQSKLPAETIFTSRPFSEDTNSLILADDFLENKNTDPQEAVNVVAVTKFGKISDPKKSEFPRITAIHFLNNDKETREIKKIKLDCLQPQADPFYNRYTEKPSHHSREADPFYNPNYRSMLQRQKTVTVLDMGNKLNPFQETDAPSDISGLPILNRIETLSPPNKASNVFEHALNWVKINGELNSPNVIKSTVQTLDLEELVFEKTQPKKPILKVVAGLLYKIVFETGGENLKLYKWRIERGTSSELKESVEVVVQNQPQESAQSDQKIELHCKFNVEKNTSAKKKPKGSSKNKVKICLTNSKDVVIYRSDSIFLVGSRRQPSK